MHKWDYYNKLFRCVVAMVIVGITIAQCAISMDWGYIDNNSHNNNSPYECANSLSIGFAEPITNWGLKHTGDGKPPFIAEDMLGTMRDNNCIYLGDTNRNCIYLTFDVGYEVGYTRDVLDVLDKHGIKAIFFLTGTYLKNTDLVNAMIDRGHSIGNHSGTHPKYGSGMSIDKYCEDVGVFATKFDDKYKADVKFFRPPYGIFDKELLSQIKGLGYTTVLWSNAIVDWDTKPINVDKNSRLIINRLHKGQILLLHITNSGTPKLLDNIIPKMIASGYSFGTPNELDCNADRQNSDNECKLYSNNIEKLYSSSEYKLDSKQLDRIYTQAIG